MSLPPLARTGLRALALLSPSLAAPPLLAQSVDEPFRFENLPRWYDVDALLPNQEARPRASATAPLDLLGDGTLDLARAFYGRLELLRQTDGALALHGLFDPTQGGDLYSPPNSYLVEDVASGRFGADPFEDLVVVGEFQQSPFPPLLQVLDVDAVGALHPGPMIPLPPGAGESVAMQVHAADLDGDGVDDPVVVQTFFPLGAGERVLVRRSLDPVWTQYALDGFPYDSVVGDVDLDGDRDLVVLLREYGSTAARLRVLRNDGSGVFPVAADVPGTPGELFVLELADPDADGDPDVLALGTDWLSSPSGPRTVLAAFPNTGAGPTGPPVVSEVPLGAALTGLDLVAGHLDADAHLDLLASFDGSKEAPSGAIVFLRGSGGSAFELASGGSFFAESLALEVDPVTGARRVLTGEGVVVPVGESGEVGGTPLTLPPSPHPTFDTSYRPLAIVDHDRDGLLDVAVQASFLGQVHLFLADGEGGFVARVVDAPAATVTRELHAADADGDGWSDYLLVGADGQDFSVLLNPDAPGPGAGSLASFPAVCEFPEVQGAAFADLDADGDADGVITCEFSDVAHLLAAHGDGTYGVRTVHFPEPAGRPDFADLNGDGVPDLYYPSRLDGGLWIHPGVGDGSLGAPFEQAFARKLYRPRPAAADLDLDGDLDLVAIPAGPFSISSNGGGLVVLENDGTGTFTLTQEVQLPYPFGRVRLADLDEDGDPDALALSAQWESALHPFRNDDGVLSPAGPALDAVAGGILSAVSGELELADVDADGLPDAVFGGYGGTPYTNVAVVAFNRTQLRADGRLEPGRSLRLALRDTRAASMPYAVLIGSLGTYPGLPLGGGELLPLAFDPPFFQLTWSAGAGGLGGLLGILDPTGRATVALPVPDLGLAVGLPLDFAFGAIDAVSGQPIASNQVARTLR